MSWECPCMCCDKEGQRIIEQMERYEQVWTGMKSDGQGRRGMDTGQGLKGVEWDGKGWRGKKRYGENGEGLRWMKMDGDVWKFFCSY